MTDFDDLKNKLANVEPWEAVSLAKIAEWRKKIARPNQLAPKGDWNIWMLLAGRGFGKSMCAAYWAFEQAFRIPGSRGVVVGPTFNAVESICFKGVTGLLRIIPQAAVKRYNQQNIEIELHNGSIITGYTAEDPDKFRGPQFHWAWLDELASFQYADEAFETLSFGMRLGSKPRWCITTTPRPIPLIISLKERRDVVCVHASSYENKVNLPDSFFDNAALLEGTAKGRQEIYGEIVPLEEGAIIKKSWFKTWKGDLPKFEYIIQSYDTAFKEKTANDPSACTVWGIFYNEETQWYSAMLIHGWYGRLTYPELRERVLYEFHNVRYGGEQFGDKWSKKADLVLIEDKGSGQSLYQDLRAVMVPAMAWNPGREDKLMRAYAISHLVKNGIVFIHENVMEEDWFKNSEDGFMKQVEIFGPDSIRSKLVHDDFVDTMTQALAYLRDSDMIRHDKDAGYAREYEREREREQFFAEERTPYQPRINPYAV